MGLFVEEQDLHAGDKVLPAGPVVALKWAKSSESDDTVLELLKLIADKSSVEETVLAVFCLWWLNNHIPFSEREGFEQSEGISATANLSAKFGYLVKSKHKGPQYLQDLLLNLVQSVGHFSHQNIYPGLHEVLLQAVAYSTQDKLTGPAKDVEDRSFKEEYLESIIKLDFEIWERVHEGIEQGQT